MTETAAPAAPAAPAATATDVPVLIGSGRSIHRATAIALAHNGRTGERLVVSCGVANRAGASQVRRARADAAITCRKCLA